jgi:hypothetical protein
MDGKSGSRPSRHRQSLSLAMSIIVLLVAGLLIVWPAQALTHLWASNRECWVTLDGGSEQPAIVLASAPVSTSFTVRVTAASPRESRVRLDLGSLPDQVTGALPVRLVSVARTSVRTVVSFTLTASPRATPGSYVVPLRGDCGNARATTNVRVKIVDGSRSGDLTVVPANAIVEGGATVRFCVRNAGREYRWEHDRQRAGALDVVGLPVGARFRFITSGKTIGGCTWLVIDVSGSTAAGKYSVTISRAGRRGRESVSVVLTVRGGSDHRFTISGNLVDQMEVGATLPLDLMLTNPNTFAIRVSRLAVELGRIDATHSTCSVSANFTRVQFSGNYAQLVVPASASVTLSSLSIPSRDWPQIGMLDTSFEQNACLGATMTLEYSGTARAASGREGGVEAGQGHGSARRPESGPG